MSRLSGSQPSWCLGFLDSGPECLLRRVCEGPFYPCCQRIRMGWSGVEIGLTFIGPQVEPTKAQSLMICMSTSTRTTPPWNQRAPTECMFLAPMHCRYFPFKINKCISKFQNVHFKILYVLINFMKKYGCAQSIPK